MSRQRCPARAARLFCLADGRQQGGVMRSFIGVVCLAAALLAAPAIRAGDAPGTADHPAIGRYPGSELVWQRVENHRAYRIATGPVTGYRQIDDWTLTEGRLTRSYYRLSGTRTHAEIWRNYRDALAAAGFEIMVEGIDPPRHTEPGGRSWSATVFAANPWETAAPAREMASGSATSGGRGTVAARKARPEGTLFVVVHVYQFRADLVGTLIDVIEAAPVETGLVTANAEAMGRDMAETGRTVLDGLMFDHDSAVLTPASAPALAEIARFLAMHPDRRFFVVGHTDSTGDFAYNRRLSQARAAAVVEALVTDHAIARDRLEAHGVGPLSPVFANAAAPGQAGNRRVELVER